MKKYLSLLTLIILLASCSDNNQSVEQDAHLKTPVLNDSLDTALANILRYSITISDSVLKMPKVDLHTLRILDSTVLKKLSKLPIVNLEFSTLYYYGLLRSENDFSLILFYQVIYSDSGDEKLILATLDHKGNFIDLIDIAAYSSPAECVLSLQSNLWRNEILSTNKQSCALLTDGGNVGDRIDSTVTSYKITPDGHFNLVSKREGHLEKLD